MAASDSEGIPSTPCFTWRCVNSLPLGAEASSETVFDALSTYICKPHVVNKRLAGVSLSENWTATGLRACPPRPAAEQSAGVAVLSRVRRHCGCSDALVLQGLDEVLLGARHRAVPWTGHVFVRKLILKSTQSAVDLFELIIVEASPILCTILPCRIVSGCEGHVEFVDLGHQFVFEDSFTEDGMHEKKLCVNECRMPNPAPTALYTSGWLSGTLLPKVVAWSSAPSSTGGKNSLRLVAIDRYYELYHEMKEKYGTAIAKVWPECTDPQKFVYEDVAIAAYLMCIWERERVMRNITDRQSFVDLGCGNGLLVYILSQEGYPGRGIDTRRRKIWSMFGKTTSLEEATIVPSDEHLFPDCDWLIGNHSDELTPWIPLIAARSSPKTCFFLLPCCPFDFVGKFVRRDTKKSVYDDYLGYVEEVAASCGFECQRDVLRIPSTKRECIIGLADRCIAARNIAVDRRLNNKLCNEKPVQVADSRTVSVVTANARSCSHSDCSACTHGSINAKDVQDCCNMFQSLGHGIADAAESEDRSRNALWTSDFACSMSYSDHDECNDRGRGLALKQPLHVWNSGFEPRPREQQIRNCTNIDRSIQDSIVLTAFHYVLNADCSTSIARYDGSPWKLGGSVDLPVLANVFSREALISMKSHFGGLQTMLRNHNHIFYVHGGKVSLRNYTVPYGRRESRNKRKTKIESRTKTKPCFYDMHHPNGCPLAADMCTYVHSSFVATVG